MLAIWLKKYFVLFQQNAFEYVAGLAQDCSNSIANTMELLQSCTKPLFQQNAFEYVDGLVQDCSSSIASALELLQSCTKPSTVMFP